MKTGKPSTGTSAVVGPVPPPTKGETPADESSLAEPFPLTRYALPATLTAFGLGFLVSGALTGGVAGACLALIFTLLWRRAEPPALVFALTFQWLQVSLGYFYKVITGRDILGFQTDTIYRSVQLSLICLLLLTVGLRWGIGLLPATGTARPEEVDESRGGDAALVMLYLFFLFGHGFLQVFARATGGLRMPVLTAVNVKWVFFFILVYRLFRRRSKWVFLILAVEVVLGFSGYFGGFKDPLIFGFMAAVFAWRGQKAPWAATAVFTAAACGLFLFWTAVKPEYRRRQRESTVRLDTLKRLELLRKVAADTDWTSRSFADRVDRSVARVSNIWQLAYALQRVPRSVPHEHGALLKRAVEHVLHPRLFFPHKRGLLHDSEKVRRYTGLQVAGEKKGVSIAFGYVPESYVDFGVPGMFFPFLLFGVLYGLGYAGSTRLFASRELSVCFTAVLFYSALYIFESGWDKKLSWIVLNFIFQGLTLYALTVLFPSAFRPGAPVPATVPEEPNKTAEAAGRGEPQR